jgi:hypothetical protein
MSHACSPPADRRRARRLSLKLRGRFLLPDGGEHPCESLDVSALGLAVAAPMIPQPGERVVVYLDRLGRLEGVVVNCNPTRFALELNGTAQRRERLARKIAELSDQAP